MSNNLERNVDVTIIGPNSDTKVEHNEYGRPIKRKRIENENDHKFEPPRKLYAMEDPDGSEAPVAVNSILIHGEDSEETVENVDSDSEENGKENCKEIEVLSSSDDTDSFNESVFNSIMKELENPEEELMDLNRSNEKSDGRIMEKIDENIGDLLDEQETDIGVKTVNELRKFWDKNIKPALIKKVTARCWTPEGDQDENGECEICKTPNPKVTTLDWSDLDLTKLWGDEGTEDCPIIL